MWIQQSQHMKVISLLLEWQEIPLPEGIL